MDRAYNVGNISNVPNDKGIYAWYLKQNLSTYDINNLIRKISDDGASASRLIEEFFNKFIFNPLREAPYKVKIEGKLKPKYKGELQYEIPNSAGIVEKVLGNPQLLYKIKEVFESVSHEFLSPIYIGMAKNLNTRLRTHVNLMKHYRESDAYSSREFSLDAPSAGGELNLDHKFAHEVVVQRRLDINELEVHILKIEFEEDIQVGIENILNRLNYPLCGRN